MPVILSKNCIVEGLLDFYCLACNVPLPSEDFVFPHIQTQNHKDLVNCIGYLEKYNGDYIRTAGGVYFCEICNVATSIATKMDAHVTEESHLSGKMKRMLKRVDNRIVVDGQGSISDNAWHGIVGSKCVLCNVEFDTPANHKRSKPHMLNLISNDIIIDANSGVYRKVEDVYQCLTCDKVLSEETLTEHLNSDKHKENATKADSMKNIEKDTQKLGLGPSSNKPRGSDVEESLTLLLAKNRGLLLKEDNTIFCNNCNIQVLPTIDNIEGHVNSSQHKEKIKTSSDKKTTEPRNIEKIPINDCIKRVGMFVIGLDKYLVIRNVCMEYQCYLGMSAHHSLSHTLTCRFCKMDFSSDNMSSHARSEPHRIYVAKCFVIPIEGEFVREIKSDLYDCGFCAHTEKDYDDMLEHLATSEHKNRRSTHESMLARNRAHVQEFIRSAGPPIF